MKRDKFQFVELQPAKNRITAIHTEWHTKTGNQEKVSCFFCAYFWHFQKSPVLCRAKGIERNPLSRLANPQAARGGQTKRNYHKFPQITVIFAFCGFVGSRGRNTAATLAKSPFAALKVLREAHTGEAATFLEQDSTTVPNFANRSFCPAGILLGLPPQARLFAACAA